VDIECESGYLVIVPLCLFRIVQGDLSSLWTARVDEDGDLALLPEAFHEPFFIDDLSDGKPEAIARFRAVKATLGST
jgi:hypothetical protein